MADGSQRQACCGPTPPDSHMSAQRRKQAARCCVPCPQAERHSPLPPMPGRGRSKPAGRPPDSRRAWWRCPASGCPAGGWWPHCGLGSRRHATAPPLPAAAVSGLRGGGGTGPWLAQQLCLSGSQRQAAGHILARARRGSSRPACAMHRSCPEQPHPSPSCLGCRACSRAGARAGGARQSSGGSCRRALHRGPGCNRASWGCARGDACWSPCCADAFNCRLVGLGRGSGTQQSPLRPRPCPAHPAARPHGTGGAAPLPCTATATAARCKPRSCGGREAARVRPFGAGGCSCGRLELSG